MKETINDDTLVQKQPFILVFLSKYSLQVSFFESRNI